MEPDAKSLGRGGEDRGNAENMDSFSVIHNSLHCAVKDRRVCMKLIRAEKVRRLPHANRSSLCWGRRCWFIEIRDSRRSVEPLHSVIKHQCGRVIFTMGEH